MDAFGTVMGAPCSKFLRLGKSFGLQKFAGIARGTLLSYLPLHPWIGEFSFYGNVLSRVLGEGPWVPYWTKLLRGLTDMILQARSRGFAA
jgi:hypothetical protein